MRKQMILVILLFAGLLVGTAHGQSLNEQLFTAVKAGDKTTVGALIAKGADVNAKDQYGSAVTVYAISHKNKDILELLLQSGVDVDAKDRQGNTALCWAHSIDIAEMLIAKGADVNAKDNRGWTLLYSVDDKAMAELLIAKGAVVNAKDNEGGTPLHHARNKAIAELLIANGADVNAKDKRGNTPLSSVGDKDVAELLIAKGADVNVKNQFHETPLNNALDSARIDVASMLISKGADLKVKNRIGQTLLGHVASGGYKDGVALLLANGADINAKEEDNHGWTPLWWAVVMQKREMVELLIAKGADLTAKASDGKTLLQWAGSQNFDGQPEEEKANREIESILVASSTAGNSVGDFQKPLTELKRHSDNEVLRATIIPEEARRHFVMGTTLFKDAKTPDDYAQVGSQFKQAVDLAPLWPDARYNLALVKEAAGDYSGAMADLKLYQQFKLSDTEARTVQDKIYALEAKADVTAKKQAADQLAAAIEQTKAKRLEQAKQLAETFRGTWYGADCWPNDARHLASLKAGGCTEAERPGKVWHPFYLSNAPVAVSFEIENDGTIKMNDYSVWAGCTGGDVFGVPQGPSLDYIRWEFRPKDGSPREIWSTINGDGTSIHISCTRPLGNAARDDVPYRYVWWTRTP